MNIKDILKKIGFKISLFPLSIQKGIEKIMPHYLRKRRKVLSETDLLIDVGANKGQYAKGSRALGYHGRIVSFEPIKEAHDILRRYSQRDRKWQTRRIALGDKNETKEIKVSENLVSSSMLSMSNYHKQEVGESVYKHTEKIEVKKLDDVFGGIYRGNETVTLKMDTQGYEGKVLRGG